jgi:quercetin dioxygenase-like cupin family protein
MTPGDGARWNAGTVVAEHGHPFALAAPVAEGEMWLTIGPATRHLRPGDRFTLARDAPHAERYGDTGAVVWVARRP